MTVMSPSFKTYTATNIVLLASDRVRIDPKLQVGANSEVVRGHGGTQRIADR